MKTLTIITPTYNRAYCLGQLYDSLVKQESRDFVWLVVDDGSSDNTGETVRGWQSEGKIELKYIRRENGGMHAALNTGYAECETEINTVIDSDDWAAPGAVEKIIDFWNENKRPDVAGIISLNAAPDGKLIGSAPDGVRECKFAEYYEKYRAKGDKKLVYRTELIRKRPYPEFEGEKFFPASYKYYYLDLEYTMLVMNEVTCIVDYNDDSMSFSKIKQYVSCARGLAYYRNEMMKISENPAEIFRYAVHYVAESKLSGSRHIIGSSSKKPYVIAALLPGIALYVLIRCKTAKK